jgi:hypothetical protein
VTIRDEHFIERQGKRMVLYSGLLELAHERGLKSIDTELIQVPNKENGEVAIARAIVELNEGKFSGIGDASPDNVSRNIKPHIIRMSETRAKARALRDAVNVGAVSFEEMGEDEVPQASRGASTSQPRGSEVERTTGGATIKAAKYLVGLRVDAGEEYETVRREVLSMGAKEVSDQIKKYSPETG